MEYGRMVKIFPTDKKDIIQIMSDKPIFVYPIPDDEETLIVSTKKIKSAQLYYY